MAEASAISNLVSVEGSRDTIIVDAENLGFQLNVTEDGYVLSVSIPRFTDARKTLVRLYFRYKVRPQPACTWLFLRTRRMDGIVLERVDEQ